MSNDKSKYKTEIAVTREISGFGGAYEAACQDMLNAGIKWLEKHPDADPQFIGYKGVFGLIKEENNDAKSLSTAITNAVSGATGAMHQAVIGHLLHIHKHGLDDWANMMNKAEL